VIGAGIALYIGFQTVNRGRQTVNEMHFTAGVQTLLALHQEFEGEPMHRTRARAAEQLLKGAESRALEDVGDLFKAVAVPVRRDLDGGSGERGRGGRGKLAHEHDCLL
jgi:hypothetical protein